MPWHPPERPVWVQRLIAHGDEVGGARHLVSLDAADLLATAERSTGLSDYGLDTWREPFDLLLKSMEEEAQLHLPGRLLARTELIRSLRNRLQLAEYWKQKPEVLEAPVEAPVFIVGSPRSGTSILHELMACDEASRAPLQWEMVHPFGDEAHPEIADRVTTFWHDLQPEYETMHANSGHLPNECIYIQASEFASDHWGGNHVVPSYERWMISADLRDCYRFHKRFLQTLQSLRGPRRWLLKAPSHMSQLRTLFDVYPDARVVRTHRDPRKTLASSINLMGTLKWMRCKEVDVSSQVRMLPKGTAMMFDMEIEARSNGGLPDDQIVDIHFADLMRDPAGSVEKTYAGLGWEFSEALRERIESYVRNKPRGSRGVHKYSLESVGLDDAEERERFKRYREHYGVEEED